MKTVPFGKMAATAALLLGLSFTGAQAQLKTTVFASGMTLPLNMVQNPLDPTIQYVLQQRGRVRIILGGVLQMGDFINLTGTVSSSGSERGLLGMTFHPNYTQNGFVYFNYTDIPSPGNTRIVRYTRDAIDPTILNPASAFPILTIAQPFANHNGGTLRFGPDNFLYIGMGDGGDGFDPGNRAQTITNMLLGKMLRINIDGDDFPVDATRNYAIPLSNPFVGIIGDDEIWSLGLRNPWKWTFDDPTKLGTGGMVIADVGQNAWEEVDYEPPLAGGRNYAWRVKEGFAFTGLPGGGNNVPFTDPIHVYSHADGNSITGGYVYRGLMLGDYFGRYFFADFGFNRVWSFMLNIDPGTGEGSMSDLIEHTSDLGLAGGTISSMDVDSQGEPYIVDYSGGRVLRILPENRCWAIGMSVEFFGALLGQLRGMSARDGKFVRTFQQTSFDFIEQNVSSLIVNMQTDMASPSFFDVFVDVRHGEPANSGSLRVSLRNWKTNLFQQVGTVPITNVLTTRSILNIPVGSFRRADGRIDVRLFAFNNNGLTFDPYVVSYDKLKVVPR